MKKIIAVLFLSIGFTFSRAQNAYSLMPEDDSIKVNIDMNFLDSLYNCEERCKAYDMDFIFKIHKLAQYCFNIGMINHSIIIGTYITSKYEKAYADSIYNQVDSDTIISVAAGKDYEYADSLIEKSINSQRIRANMFRLAGKSYALNEYAEIYADPQFESAIRIYNNFFMNEKKRYIHSIYERGIYRLSKYDYSKARKCFELAKEEIENRDVDNEESAFPALFLQEQKAIDLCLSICQILQYEHEQAIPILLQLIDDTERGFTKDSPQYALVLNQLANAYIQSFNDSLPSQYLQEAINIYNKSIPSLQSTIQKAQIPESILSLCHTAYIYKIGDQPQEALRIYNETTSLLKKIIGNQWYALQFYEHDQFWRTLEPYFTDLEDLAITHQELVETAQLLYDNTLIKKTLSFSPPREYQRLFKTDCEKEISEVISQLDSCTNDLDVFEDYIHGKLLPKAINDCKIVLLDKEVLQYKIEHNYLKETNTIPDWQYIQKLLDNEDAAIEFISVDKINYKPIKTYFALVLTKKNPPLIIPICREEELEKALSSKDRSQLLYKALWKPLEKALVGYTNLYLSGIGLINHISFVEIKLKRGYLCDKYNIHTLSSTANIEYLKKSPINPKDIKNAYLFGGVNFEEDTEEEDIDKEEPMRGQGFSYLPETKKEVLAISNILHPQQNTYLFIGNKATESAFKSLSEKQELPNVIHISTHGFLLDYSKKMGDPSMAKKSYFDFYDPMIRSGLALTSSNGIWKGNQTIKSMNDGIINAYEISSINLSNTKLVVLSACKTGLGDVFDREITYGLRKGFYRAGVKSLIVSLGNVPDKETSELMQEFYVHWNQESTIWQAFTKAQRMMRNKYPNNPEKWAGFTLIE